MRKLKVVAAALALAIALMMPMSLAASTGTNLFDDPQIRVEDGVPFVPLRLIAYAFDATVTWDRETRSAHITVVASETVIVEIEAIGGFIEYGTAWVPLAFVEEVLVPLFMMGMAPEANERVDPYLWYNLQGTEVRDTTHSTSLPYGAIALAYLEYMSDNLGARSAFTYAELATAIWIVEELLAMGYTWDDIDIQEFTYWEIQDLGLGLMPLNWELVVTSPGVLGVGREYQLRPDRVSQNVVLTLPGESNYKIIVGAHYDSPPYASASDNASGTALLLEAAQRMMELDHYYTIVFVWFGAEEVGLTGAYYYYELLTQAQRNNILMMVNADVIIEGPYIIYSAGSRPELSPAEIANIVDEVIYSMMDIMVAAFDGMMEEVAAMGIEDPLLVLPFDSLEGYVSLITASLLEMGEGLLLMEAARLGLVGPVIDPVAAQVTALAAALNQDHDFDILSMPELITTPSDQLVFLFEGHTVVNLVGLERYGVLDPEFTARLTRYGEFASEFTATILHTPYDEIHFIEALWPGMMAANLEAFLIFVQEILTSRFTA